MNCAECGHQMDEMEGMHRYDESGLKNIHLMNVPIYKCQSCGETEVEIPGMEELHLLLGLLIAYQPKRLNADEVRYLRKHMGYSQEELAEKLGITRPTIARWEADRTITLGQDIHLRRFYLGKKGKELDSFTSVHRILLALLDKLPNPTRKQKVQIRREDWLTQQDEIACSPA